MSDGLPSSDHRHHHHLMHKQPLFNFKFSPETTNLLWSVHSPAPSDEDAWNLIYAAAGHVARMKMTMGTSDEGHGFVNNNNNRGMMGDEVFRQQRFCRNRCVVAAWGPPQNYLNQHKLVVGGGGVTTVKRECAGTGVFLPRRYCTDPPEMIIRQACPSTNLPARMIQYSTTPPQIQSSHYEMLMSQRKAMISGDLQQSRTRSSIHRGVIDNPEMLLPQEWTY